MALLAAEVADVVNEFAIFFFAVVVIIPKPADRDSGGGAKPQRLFQGVETLVVFLRRCWGGDLAV